MTPARKGQMDAKPILIPTLRERAVTADVPAQVAASRTGGWRVLLAEHRASARSELAEKLEQLGHEVLARVTTGQGALDYAELVRPDAVLMTLELEDGPAIMTALKLTRALAGTAAIVLTNHPGAADPSTRPNWGPVTLVHADAELAKLDAEIRRAVATARESADDEVSSQPIGSTAPELAVMAALEMEESGDDEALVESELADADAAAARREVRSVVAEARVDQTPAAPAPDAPSVSEPSALSFTDEDLFAIGPFVDVPETPRSSVAYDAPLVQPITAPADANDVSDDEIDVIAQAAESLLERTGLSRSDAMRLMEQEAVDTEQRVIDVARAVLGQDAASAVSGEVALVG